MRLVFVALIALGLLAGTAGAGGKNPKKPRDERQRMDLLYTNPNNATTSDLAFWGDHAFVGYYTGDTGSPAGTAPRGGVRIFDISNPAAPTLVKDVQCDANQNDPIVWDRNGNGVADLLLVAVDRTMASPMCGAPRAAHDDPTGWEGVRVFELSDDPANPFATVNQVAAVYTDCGAHTITLWPGNADEGELIVYVASYPLRPGPTCGQVNGPPAGNDPLHSKISVIEVPLANPAASSVIAEPPIGYPDDPDNQIDWTERGLVGLEPAARACHDIVVHVPENMAGAACAEQGQVWDIDPDTGIPDTANPISVIDDEVTSGGTGNIPGAVDFFHSVMFNNSGTVLNTVDESFGTGCPPMTTYQPRMWNPAGGTHKTGRMFFSDTETGDFFSEFQVGDVRPDPAPGAYCSAHMGMAVMDIRKDLLVNAWYTGGVDVINFTDPEKLKEIAWYDIAGPAAEGSDNWSAYPYVGPDIRGRNGIPVYASDGVRAPALGRGFQVFRANVPEPNVTRGWLNPQTMD
ncbi:MAG: hypothetical protein ACRDLZ_04855 [Gaiellaceae bacterium]